MIGLIGAVTHVEAKGWFFTNETLTIGQLAQRFGLNTSAIRYYEASAVLPGRRV